MRWSHSEQSVTFRFQNFSVSKLFNFFSGFGFDIEKIWFLKIYWDPRIFWDDINIMFSSRDWWDPGIFLDGTSSIGICWNFLVQKRIKAFEIIVLFNILNPEKSWDFIFIFQSQDPGIYGDPGIQGSSRGLARSCKTVSWHASANLGLIWKWLQIKDQCRSELELTRKVELMWN